MARSQSYEGTKRQGESRREKRNSDSWAWLTYSSTVASEMSTSPVRSSDMSSAAVSGEKISALIRSCAPTASMF